ncbi:MAG: c-type cytochrome [Proteobacteria bacterium]|jgi:cytochrome c|nr:c-type cytochrome [Pseudomonadota bacterium]
MRHPFKALFFVAMFTCCASAQAFDAVAAKALAKSNTCTKCHDPGKEATPFKKIAEKYRNDPQAETKLIKHLTTNPQVTFLDGSKDEHKTVRMTPANDEAQLKNLIQWVLSH